MMDWHPLDDTARWRIVVEAKESRVPRRGAVSARQSAVDNIH